LTKGVALVLFTSSKDIRLINLKGAIEVLAGKKTATGQTASEKEVVLH
jgi:hypothetical protein